MPHVSKNAIFFSKKGIKMPGWQHWPSAEGPAPPQSISSPPPPVLPPLPPLAESALRKATSSSTQQRGRKKKKGRPRSFSLPPLGRAEGGGGGGSARGKPLLFPLRHRPSCDGGSCDVITFRNGSRAAARRGALSDERRGGGLATFPQPLRQK